MCFCRKLNKRGCLNSKTASGDLIVAGSIEISNQTISDLLEFVKVAEEMFNTNVMKRQEISVY
jgi:hypothetical protein